LREWRRTIAAQEEVAAFVIFTDAELAEISKLPEITPKAIQGIKGIGQKKVEKYGDLLMKAIKEEKNETKKQPDVQPDLF
jgi:superfamily II DNA helicase RecQ